MDGLPSRPRPGIDPGLTIEAESGVLADFCARGIAIDPRRCRSGFVT